MSAADEYLIHGIIAEEQAAWNAGDAKTFAARFHAEGSFTNVFGDRYFGRESVDSAGPNPENDDFAEYAQGMYVRSLALRSGMVGGVSGQVDGNDVFRRQRLRVRPVKSDSTSGNDDVRFDLG